jgi:hypothetical protein
MTKRAILIGTAALLGAWNGARAAADDPAAHYRATLDRYCVTCHNSVLKTAGMVLETADVADIGESPETWERVVTKLTLAAMPPTGMPRPEPGFYSGFLEYLKTELGALADAGPDPGRSTVHRLNRFEYANAVRDLLAIEVDVSELLPPDNIGGGFDNIAEVLAVSPLLMERYLFTAGRISSLAVGPRSLKPASETYKIAEAYRQQYRMDEELPFGTRGGTAVRHRFPLDGEYTIDIRMRKNIEGYIRGIRDRETIDVRLDHERIGTLEFGGEILAPSGPTWTANQVVQYAGHPDQVAYEFSGDEVLQLRFRAEAGDRLVGVAFAGRNAKQTGFLTGEMTRLDIESYKGGLQTIESVTITGPFDPEGPGETASREKIFSCRPAEGAPAEEAERCAREIFGRLARQAYRRPVSGADVDYLVDLYRQGRRGEGFEAGIELGLQGILSGPEFLFRIEQDPPGAAEGDVYPVSDIELASRLSFFLWSTIPDAELLAVAEQGRLRERAMLEAQVRRMIADDRFEAFVSNFGRQWLAVRDVEIAEPNIEIFPEFDDELRDAYKQEMLLWFASLVRDDHSVLELLTSDYTYANERLAKHYGLDGISGSRLRPVELPDASPRSGLFGKGGFLTATAFNNRTSPVLRGKWVLENLINMPPPAPPENVPALQVESGGKALTLKQAMERHRANPVCAGCHKLMDPIGFALENFDAIGAYRTHYEEAAEPVDVSGLLFDGTEYRSSDEFRQEFMKHSARVVHTATEKILTYALGRGLEYYDQPTVRQIVAGAAARNYSWSSIILGVIESTPFQYRRATDHDAI